jgi:hypothetical protein
LAISEAASLTNLGKKPHVSFLVKFNFPPERIYSAKISRALWLVNFAL